MSAMTVTSADMGWGARRTVHRPESRVREGRAVSARHLRLTARGRALLVVLGLALAGFWTVLGPGAHAGDPQPGIEVTAVTVAPGQTLWQIARSVATPEQDVRDVVDELVRLNGLDGVALRAGQQLLVPSTTGR